MDQSFFAGLERLELMAFFSGYPLVYALIYLVAGKQQTRTKWKKRLVSVLPFAYALTATLYWGLQLKNAYPDYAFDHILNGAYNSILKIWGLLAILFWIPALSRKTIFSLLHSLVFFYLLLRDLFFQVTSPSFDRLFIQNDMKVYTDSIILNLGAVVLLVIVYALFRHYYRPGQSATY